MSMIFPGMDPYLEDPIIWPGVHSRLVVYIADHLQPLLGQRYIAAVEERVYLQGPDREVAPDVWLRHDQPAPLPKTTAPASSSLPILVEAPELEIHESYVNILDRISGQQVICTIEVVSPTNKYAGKGRDLYEEKQRDVRASQASLVEIDLHRTGPHVLAVPFRLAKRQGPYDYLVSVNRARKPRHVFELYPFRVRDPLPPVRVPLAEDDPDVILDLRRPLEHLYGIGNYSNRLKYDAPCLPPLSPEDQEWANRLIRQARSSG